MIPPEVIVAIDTFELAHVPPFVGEIEVVSPIQIVVGPLKLITGVLFTVKAVEAIDVHPVSELVNVNVAEPASIAVIIPELLIVATAVSELAHIPPDEGVMVVVSPIHKSLSSNPLIVGSAFTSIEIKLSEIHP